MRSKHVFSASVRLLPREEGGLPGWFIPVDETTGKAIAFGFPIGHAPDWYESRWEFEPLTWPSKAPSFNQVKPDLSLPAKLRARPDATKAVLALASKLEIVPTLPSAPDPWLLSDREFALLARIAPTDTEVSK